VTVAQGGARTPGRPTSEPSGRVDGPCAHVRGGVAMPKFVQYRERNQDLAEERGQQIDLPDQGEIVQRRRGMGGSPNLEAFTDTRYPYIIMS
jgi:hypothetical protein